MKNFFFFFFVVPLYFFHTLIEDKCFEINMLTLVLVEFLSLIFGWVEAKLSHLQSKTCQDFAKNMKFGIRVGQVIYFQKSCISLIFPAKMLTFC